MNIFASSLSPLRSARDLDNKRVVKMITETTQMLSTAIYIQAKQVGAPHYESYPDSLLIFFERLMYRPSWINHPCAKWCRETRENYTWLCLHGLNLCEEYTHRYGKKHKCHRMIGKAFLYRHFFPEGGLTPFANCTGMKQDEIDLNSWSVTEAYRECLRRKWKNDKRPPQWKNRSEPDWYTVLNVGPVM